MRRRVQVFMDQDDIVEIGNSAISKLPDDQQKVIKQQMKIIQQRFEWVGEKGSMELITLLSMLLANDNRSPLQVTTETGQRRA